MMVNVFYMVEYFQDLKLKFEDDLTLKRLENQNNFNFRMKKKKKMKNETVNNSLPVSVILRIKKKKPK
jgi:hypothetical protein